MIRLHRSACDRHALPLLEFADGHAAGPETDAALRHLAGCPTCERDVADAALLIFGLRRLGASAARVQPPAGGWGRLASRMDAGSRRPGFLPPPLRLAGVAIAPLLALALAVPFIAPTAPCGSSVDRPAPTCAPTEPSGGWHGPQPAFLISDAANGGDVATVPDGVVGVAATGPEPGTDDDRRLGPSVNLAAPAAQPAEGAGAEALRDHNAPPTQGVRGPDLR